MSMPQRARSTTVDDIPIGIPVGRAWLRPFGVLPFDYDRLCIVELVPGLRFHEESTMASTSRWRHERSVTTADDGTTVVHDRVTFQPRLLLRPATPLLRVGIRAFFGHRHRRLRRYFDWDARESTATHST